MGRTVPTFNQVLLSELGALQKYRRALRREEQEVFDELMSYARHHVAESAYAGHLNPFEVVLLSVMIEVGKRLKGLERGSLPPGAGGG